MSCEKCNYFWASEKIFLLHEEFKKEKPRYNRMSRHLYDLEKLMDTTFGINALNDSELYNEIVTHRSVFNRIPYVDYATHSPATIDFLPPDRVVDKWIEGYNSLTEHLLFSTSRKLSFEGVIDRM